MAFKGDSSLRLRRIDGLANLSRLPDVSIATGRLPRHEEDPWRPHARQAPRDQGSAATTMAQAHPGNGQMACASRWRLFRLSRRADKQPGAERIPVPRPAALASSAMSAQPAGKTGLDAHDEIGRRVSSQAEYPASLAERPLRRQTPEVGAGCGNSACPELSGGRGATRVPTRKECAYGRFLKN